MEHEEAKLAAEFPVVAFFRLFQADEVLLQLLPRLEGHAVHALHLFPLLIAAPIRPRNAGEPEAVRIDLIRLIHMRPAAKIREIPGLIHADFSHAAADKVRIAKIRDGRGSAGLEVAKQFDFEVLQHRSKHVAGSVDRHLRALEAKVLLHFVTHPFFNGLQIVGRERPVEVNIVEEAVFDHRSDAELRFRKQFLNARGHDVRQRMTFRFEFFVFHKKSVRVSILRSCCLM